MPLFVIYGPPNSGRTGKVRQEYLDLLERNPVLVVPSVDDIFTWERRFARDTGALVGGRIVHFRDLCKDILSGADSPSRPVASELQRRRLARESIQETWPELAGRLAQQPGLIASTLDLVDDFRANLLDPDTLGIRIEGVENRRLELVLRLYREFLGRLEANGLTDWPGRYLEATKVNLTDWSATPVFVAGFDDLTAQQLELLLRLSEHTDVTVAITHELGNPAMALTAELFSVLTSSGATVKAETERPSEALDHHPQLFEVEKRFMRDDAGGQLTPDDAIRIMRSSGKRNEAEVVAARIAKLVDSGVAPGEIAIAIDNPATGGPIFRDVLAEYAIPVTLESETAAAATATGQSVLALLAATSPRGTAADLLRFLRGPSGPDPEAVDRLERQVLRGEIESVGPAMRMFTESGSEAPAGWEDLTSAGDDGARIAEVIGKLVLEIGSGILDRDRALIPSGQTLTETQAATAISRACSELTSMNGARLSRDMIVEAIESDAIKVWAVPAEGTTRIASPYSLRAKRVKHLFYVSLQEGGITDSDRSGPFLSSPERSDLALPDYSDPELQARYLFYSCLSVPTEGLWLSCRMADETGKAEYPSPLIGAVEDLFVDGLVNPGGIAEGRTGSEITFPPDRAPSLDELARSIAARPNAEKGHDIAEIEPADADRILGRLDTAREADVRTRRLSGLVSEAVLAEIAAKGTFSATAVEAYAGCPYRWFIERQLRPDRLGPDPDYLAFGNLLHGSMHALYAAHPHRLPRSDDLDDWVGQVAAEVDRQAGKSEVGLGSESPQHRALRSRARELISGFLIRESLRESPSFEPTHLEIGFGLGDSIPAIEMDGWQLVGKVDRIDTSGEEGGPQRGVVIDYKSGSTSILSFKDIDKKRRLQLQLYMYAISQTWEGMNPVGGLYVLLAAKDTRPRGIFDVTEAGAFDDFHPYDNDGSPELEVEIGKAVDLANHSVSKILAGVLDHDPATCPDHYDNPAVPDRIVSDGDESPAPGGSR